MDICFYLLRWLILCQFDWTEEYPEIASKTLSLHVSVGIFLEGIIIWVNRLSKDHSHHYRWAASNSSKGCQFVDELNGEKRLKKKKKQICALCFLWDIYLLLLLDIRSPGSQASRLRQGPRHWSLILRPLELERSNPPAFWSLLQTPDHDTSQPP